MEGFASDLITLLQFLLPGFLAAWVFYGLTSHPKPSQFERVVQALIFTLIVKVVVSLLRALLLFAAQRFSLLSWTEGTELVTSALVAVLFGVALAYIANTDRLHAFCRRIGLTGR